MQLYQTRTKQGARVTVDVRHGGLENARQRIAAICADYGLTRRERIYRVAWRYYGKFGKKRALVRQF